MQLHYPRKLSALELFRAVHKAKQDSVQPLYLSLYLSMPTIFFVVVKKMFYLPNRKIHWISHVFAHGSHFSHVIKYFVHMFDVTLRDCLEWSICKIGNMWYTCSKSTCTHVPFFIMKYVNICVPRVIHGFHVWFWNVTSWDFSNQKFAICFCMRRFQDSGVESKTAAGGMVFL